LSMWTPTMDGWLRWMAGGGLFGTLSISGCFLRARILFAMRVFTVSLSQSL
jgi:hypothetical protein